MNIAYLYSGYHPYYALTPRFYFDFRRERILTVGTETTVYDEAEALTLVNPTAGTQPIWEAEHVDFNNKPVLILDSDYVKQTISNYRSADASGMFHFVGRVNSGINCHFFTSSQESTNNRTFGFSFSSNKFRFSLTYVSGSAITNTVECQEFTNNGSSFTVSVGSNNTGYVIYINGVLQSLTVISGSNDGNWLNNIASRENIVIGSRISLTQQHSQMIIAFLMYTTFLTQEQVTQLYNFLHAEYKIGTAPSV